MRKLLMTLLLVLLFVSGPQLRAADDPSIQSEPRAESQKAMSQHIKQNSYKDKYIIYDTVTGKLLNLDFKELHKGMVKKGEFFVSCADFVDGSGNQYDLDFLVGEEGGNYRVFGAIVHSVNGEKRIYHIED
jgi:hypothetical protein